MATAHSANGLTTAQALERLDALYYQAVNALRNAIKTLLKKARYPTRRRAPTACLFTRSCASAGTALRRIKTAAAPGVDSAMPVATPPPLPARNCCATICANSCR